MTPSLSWWRVELTEMYADSAQPTDSDEDETIKKLDAGSDSSSSDSSSSDSEPEIKKNEPSKVLYASKPLASGQVLYTVFHADSSDSDSDGCSAAIK